MVEIRYGDQYEIADLAGQTVSEAREQFRAEFGIPDKARAKLNGQKVKGGLEPDTVLNDDDQLSFAVAKGKGAYLVGALLLALAVTGGVFAYGWISASTTLTLASITAYDFASVSENTDGKNNLSWTGYGFFRGAMDNTPQPIFNIDTDSSGYTGDLVVTVSLGNVGELSKYYRVLGFKLYMATPDGNWMDIDGDGDNTTDDWVLLTLRNGSVDMFCVGSDNVCTVRVKSGFYITNIAAGFAGGSEDPNLFCEVAQR